MLSYIISYLQIINWISITKSLYELDNWGDKNLLNYNLTYIIQFLSK